MTTNPSELGPHAASVAARAIALEEVMQGRRKASGNLVLACRSTVRLAALSEPSLGITPLGSRNTLFKYANALLNDKKGPNGEVGWKYLDFLRISVYQSYRSVEEAASSPPRDASLKKYLDETQRAMLAQSTAYVSLIRRVRALARSNDVDALVAKRMLNLLNDHDDVFGGVFSPSVVELVRPNNVRKFDERE